MKNLAETARRLSRRIKPGMSFDDARDVADGFTGGELECFELDLLTQTAWNIADARISAHPQREASSILNEP